MPTPLEHIAMQILAKHPLEARSLTQDLLRHVSLLSHAPAPTGTDPTVRAIAAGLAELIASRHGTAPPAWTSAIGALPAPVYLVEATARSASMRARLERESPEPLRKRNLFAPASYLALR